MFRDYLSKQHITCLKGAMAALVLAHHIYQHINVGNSLVMAVMMILGPAAVSVFLFISGYGLMESIKRENYFETFLERRVLPFYIIYCIICIIYIIQKWMLDFERITFRKVITSFLFGYTYVSNGWYFQTIIILYLLFYLVQRMRIRNKCVCMGLLLSVYCLICVYMKLEVIWYQCVFSFLGGMIFSKYQKHIDSFFEKKTPIIPMLISFGILLSFVSIKHLSMRLNNYQIKVGLQLIAFTVFPFFIVFAMMCVDIRNKALTLVGGVSFEIYAVQGFFFNLFRNKYLHISNDWMYSIVVVLCTLVSAKPLHILWANFKRKISEVFLYRRETGGVK